MLIFSQFLYNLYFFILKYIFMALVEEKKIRQWPINLSAAQIMIHKITPSVN